MRQAATDMLLRQSSPWEAFSAEPTPRYGKPRTSDRPGWLCRWGLFATFLVASSFAFGTARTSANPAPHDADDDEIVVDEPVTEPWLGGEPSSEFSSVAVVRSAGRPAEHHLRTRSRAVHPARLRLTRTCLGRAPPHTR